MLYKSGNNYTSNFLENGKYRLIGFDYIIVDESDVEHQLSNGWCLTLDEIIKGKCLEESKQKIISSNESDKESFIPPVKKRGRPSGSNKTTNN